MEWEMRKIDLLEHRKAKVYCKDGTVYIGTGDCLCDASDGIDNIDVDGVAFDTDDGEGFIFAEDDIERIELLW